MKKHFLISNSRYTILKHKIIKTKPDEIGKPKFNHTEQQSLGMKEPEILTNILAAMVLNIEQ